MKLNATIINTALFFQQLGLLASHQDMAPCSVNQVGEIATIVFPATAVESTDFIVSTLTQASQGAACSGIQIV